MKITLVGLPGVGKTYTGKRLADYLRIPFYDLDALIEEASHQSVQDWFANAGEEKFRSFEREVLHSFISDPQIGSNWVLACGGGTPCFHDNLQILSSNSTMVYLKDSPTELARRFTHSKNIDARPLLKGQIGKQLVDQLQGILRNRRGFYEQSHIITDVSSVSPPQLLTKHLLLFTD